jgi:hypothetical protein
MFGLLLIATLCAVLGAVVDSKATAPLKKPFLTRVNDNTHIIGNGLWNLTIVRGLGRKLYYKETELVGQSPGHYVSYSAW